MEGTTVSPSTRIGRRGDPRMHRAVAARIANPSLSLFQALQLGGFDYENDDDPNQLDSEKIALLQRKNQLSRRIRYTLRQQSMPQAKCCERLKDPKSGGHDRVSNAVQYASKIIPNRKVRTLESTNGELCKPDGRESPNEGRTMGIDVTDFESIIVEEIQKAMEASTEFLSSDSKEEQGNDWRSVVSEHEELIDMSSSYVFPIEPSESLAISSLHHTAASMGMNLEQLALLLSSKKHLATILHHTSVAIPLETHKSSRVVNQCMRMHENTALVHHQLQEALSAWKTEGQRLRRLIAQCQDQGRTPILHQPVGYEPHIDFLVDHCVECFGGIRQQSDVTTAEAVGERNCENPNAQFFSSNTDPILHDRSDIDWESNEWDLDLFRSDSIINLLALTNE